MQFASLYLITDEGKDWPGVSRLINDWTQHLVESSAKYPFGHDEKYVIVFHPATFAEIQHNSDESWTGLRLPHITSTPDVDSTPDMPIDRVNVSVMNMDISVSTVLNKDEMLIISKDMLELFDRFVHRVAEENYHRGKLHGFREFHPQFRGASPDRMDDAKIFDRLIMDAAKKIAEARK